MIFCNVVTPQIFWFKKFRQSIPAIFAVAFFVTIGMWFERFVIIVTSLHRAFLPGEWHMFFATPVDILTFVGSIGTFLTLYLLFMRFLPMFAMSEIKNVTPWADPHGDLVSPSVFTPPTAIGGVVPERSAQPAWGGVGGGAAPAGGLMRNPEKPMSSSPQGPAKGGEA
jgi:hypothetical protein